MSVSRWPVSRFESAVSSQLPQRCSREGSCWRFPETANRRPHGRAPFQGASRCGVVLRIVFQVGVLNQDHVAACPAKAVRSAAPLPRL